MAYIYKITNTQNGKIYVGKTLDAVEKRFKEHCRDSRRERCEKRPLYDAMNKYGIDSFKVETIEECNEKEINERETYWIEKLGSFKYGYNATVGGDGKRYADYDLIYSLWKEGKNELEIQEILKYDIGTIKKALYENSITPQMIKQRANDKMKKGVAMLDIQSQEILCSLREARDYLKKGPGAESHISAVCKGKRKTAYGYSWKYLI